MRVCPKCKRRFPDNTLFCPDDGKALVDRTEEREAVAADGGDDFDAMETIEKYPGADNTSRASNSGPSGLQQSAGRPKSSSPTHQQAPPDLVSDRSAKASSPSHRDAATMDTSNLIGQHLFGEYTIIKKLGEGGMGSVYLAEQDSIDQQIAVKVLHEESAESDELVQRFHREAKVVSMLSHPNIIRVFIFGRTDANLLYLAMEYVQGDTLRDLIDREYLLDEMRAIKIMKQICSGLSEAHDLGIIHRDLKPDNVLLTEFRGEEDFAKILDFGIAKLKQPEGGEEQQKLTQAGIVYGTPEYLSPEQAQALDLDLRTDIYSLGCILYEFMTGQVPFRASTPVKILTAHVFNEVVPPSQLSPDRVTPTMENIILKAMSKEPGDRFDDALEMFEALVAREQELVQQQGLGNRAGYVPGMELTGMYRAADVNLDAPAETADVAADRFHNPGTSSPVPTASTPASAGPPATTSASGDNSSTRLVIYLLIAGIGMLFVVLLVTIGFMVLA